MAPLGPLTTNRLTVRLDPERAARIEYWASENPLKIRSYNQLIQEALDEYLDRHTVSPTHDSMNVKIPQRSHKYLVVFFIKISASSVGIYIFKNFLNNHKVDKRIKVYCFF